MIEHDVNLGPHKQALRSNVDIVYFENGAYSHILACLTPAQLFVSCSLSAAGFTKTVISRP